MRPTTTVLATCFCSFLCSMFVNLSAKIYRYHAQETIVSNHDALSSITSSSKIEEAIRGLHGILPTLRDVEDMSSVDYMACCGAGHRLSKMADANYVAKHLNFSLRSFWGYCDEVEVFNYIFGPQPILEILHVTEFNHYARIHNDVAGFSKLQRLGPKSECLCSFDKISTDAVFYESMRNRFSGKAKVDNFVKQHFLQNVTSIGIHIRAGNGESGDFTDRGRAIEDEDSWLRNVAGTLQKQKWGAAILFVATDTSSMLGKLQLLLNGSMPLVHVDQSRPIDGSGVLFGERGQVLNQGAECLRGWENTLTDMMILSHVDVLVSARPSSFTQSLPMSLLFSRPTRPALKPYCELNRDGTELKCYASAREWCCIGETSFSLEGIQRYDYLRMPIKSFDKVDFKVKVRNDVDCTLRPDKQVCLPYDYSTFMQDSAKSPLLKQRPKDKGKKRRIKQKQNLKNS